MDSANYECIHNPKKDGCFLATACIEYAGLPDDCKELQIMREFRDNYVAKLPDGPKIIAEYYEVAPNIIQSIKNDHAESLIFSYMLSQLRVVTDMIENGKFAQAHLLYMAEYKKLRDRYEI